MATPKSTSRRFPLRALLVATVAVLAAYVLVTHRHSLGQSLSALGHAQPTWIGLGLVLMAITFCIAAGIYGALALHPLRYRQTVLIEVSTAFVNRLLPSGIGGLGLHGVYLYKRKHSAAEATAVVSVNNLLGIGAHLLLLTILLIVQPQVLRGVITVHFSYRTVLIVATAAVVFVCLIGLLRQRLLRFVMALGSSLRRMPPLKLITALGLAACLTLTYTLILYVSSRAVGVHLPLLQTFVVFSAGMLASTATPTPGGLVGAEAGLYAGFVAYGVSGVSAGAAVLLYRLLTYWIPLLPGLVALGLARRHKLV